VCGDNIIYKREENEEGEKRARNEKVEGEREMRRRNVEN
jgi:hypothetical protein